MLANCCVWNYKLNAKSANNLGTIMFRCRILTQSLLYVEYTSNMAAWFYADFSSPNTKQNLNLSHFLPLPQ